MRATAGAAGAAPDVPAGTCITAARDEHLAGRAAIGSASIGTCIFVVVCHGCTSRLDPDMWIGSRCWESLSPVLPLDQLPPRDRCGKAVFIDFAGWPIPETP